jgi:hypothetical protein
MDAALHIPRVILLFSLDGADNRFCSVRCLAADCSRAVCSYYYLGRRMAGR